MLLEVYQTDNVITYKVQFDISELFNSLKLVNLTRKVTYVVNFENLVSLGIYLKLLQCVCEGCIDGFHVMSYQANFVSHHTHDRHVGFLSPQAGIGKHNKMSQNF